MSPGLVRMLEMIKSNSNDSMLVDRFLVLASDMPEREKADATLRLARTLLKNAPRKAIEIAWMVYNSSLKDAESLSLIADAFDGLGKEGKGELIRSELKRIMNGNLSPEVRNLARLTVEEHVTTTLADKDLSPVLNKDEADTNPMTILDLGLADAQIQQKAEAISLRDEVDGLAKDPLATQGPTEIKFDLSLSEGDGSIVRQPEKFSSKKTDDQELNMPSLARVSAALPSDGLPEAIPPREPSKHSVSVKHRDGRRQSAVTSGERSPRANIEPTTKITSFEDPFLRLEELAKVGSWDRLVGLLKSAFPHGDHPQLLSFFERNKLHKIDITFADLWLDVLIAARQERRAIRFIVTRLSEEPHLAWARMVFPKVQKITAALNLRPVEWRESDGVLALRDRIARQKPRLGSYWAA